MSRARYRVYPSIDGPEFENPWVDMPEAEPRTRARLKADAGVPEAFVVVNDAGGVDYDEVHVEIDNSVYYE